MQNPLIKSNNTINIDDNVIEITYLNSIKYFKYAYVLTKISDYEIPDSFYNSIIDEKLYEDVSKKLMLKKVSINILILTFFNIRFFETSSYTFSSIFDM